MVAGSLTNDVRRECADVFSELSDLVARTQAGTALIERIAGLLPQMRGRTRV